MKIPRDLSGRAVVKALCKHWDYRQVHRRAVISSCRQLHHPLNGAGLAVQTPELQRDPGLRLLPLSGFPSLSIGVFWRGRLGEIAQAFVDRLAERAKEVFAQAKAPTDL